MPGLQLFYGLRLKGVDILDILGFIQDPIKKFTGIFTDVIAKRIVGGDIHRLLLVINGADRLTPPTVGSVDGDDLCGSVKTGKFTDPVENKAFGADDQTGLFASIRFEQGDDLDGLAKAHIVRQYSSHAIAGQDRQPAESFRLVIAEFCRQLRQRNICLLERADLLYHIPQVFVNTAASLVREGLDGGDHGNSLFPVEVFGVHAEILHGLPQITRGLAAQVDDPVAGEENEFLLFPQAGDDLFQIALVVVALFQENTDKVIFIGHPDDRLADRPQFFLLQVLGEIDIGQALEAGKIQTEEIQDMAFVRHPAVFKAQRAEIILQKFELHLIDPLCQFPCRELFSVPDSHGAGCDRRFFQIKVCIETDSSHGKLPLHTLVHIDHLKKAGINIFSEVPQDRFDTGAGIAVHQLNQTCLIRRSLRPVDDTGFHTFAVCLPGQKVTPAGKIEEILRLPVQIRRKDIFAADLQADLCRLHAQQTGSIIVADGAACEVLKQIPQQAVAHSNIALVVFV